MEFYINPKYYVAEFLYSKIEDPLNRLTETTETIPANNPITLNSDNVVSIQSIIINGTTLKKWKDYFFDYKNSKIYFKTTPTEDIEVTYRQTDKPFILMNKNATENPVFPVITIDSMPSPVSRLGQYNAPTQARKSFQINVYNQDGTFYSDENGVSYEGDSLTDYLCYRIIRIIRKYEEELHPVMYELRISSDPEDLPFDYEMQANHKILIMESSIINIGEFIL